MFLAQSNLGVLATAFPAPWGEPWSSQSTPSTVCESLVGPSHHPIVMHSPGYTKLIHAPQTKVRFLQLASGTGVASCSLAPLALRDAYIVSAPHAYSSSLDPLDIFF